MRDSSTGHPLPSREELYRKAFEEGPLGMAIVGLDYRFVEVNDQFCRILGYSREELAGLTFPEITHPADIDMDVRLASQLFEGSIPHYRIRKRYLTKGGDILWANLSASVIRDPDGCASYGLAMLEDISEQKRIEENLRASEERFRSFAENMEAVSWIADARPERILFVNSAFERIWGRRAEELYSDDRVWIAAIHPDDRQGVGERYEQWLNGATAEYAVEYRIVRPDGGLRWISDRGFKLYDDQGRLFRICGIAEDVSERKKAEQAVERARSELQDLLENAPLAMLISEGPDERVVSINRLFRELIGYTPAEIPDVAHWWPLAYPEARYRHRIQALWHQRMQEAITTRRQMEPVEAEITCKDGKRRIFAIHATSVGPRHLIIFVDLTEVRQLEKQLREAEARFRASFQYAPIGMALVSKTGQWLQVNRVLCDLLGYSEGEMLRLTFQDITHPDDLEKDLRLVRELTEGQRDGYAMEKRYFRKDGHVVWILLSVSVIREEGREVLYFIAQMQDITGRKGIEAEREELIRDLQEALGKVKTLRGLLPICSSCKKIRDDQGYWNQIESYISAHSDAEFSHGVCPSCAKKLYPGYYERIYGSRKEK